MKLAELLNSLTDAERDFMASLDYGQDQQRHRLALDLVLARGGQVDMVQQYWFPYKVIELGKNWLQPGRDREYAACLAMVLENIRTGADTSTDLEYLIDSQYAAVATLPSELRQLIDSLLDALIQQGGWERCREARENLSETLRTRAATRCWPYN